MSVATKNSVKEAEGTGEMIEYNPESQSELSDTKHCTVI